MKMKLFFAAVAVVFTVGILASCGNKKTTATAEETTEQVCDSTKACCAEKADSLACDSAKTCGAEKEACCAEKAKTAE